MSSRRAGLTLIEVIISISVFAVLMLAVLAVMVPMTRSTTGATLGLEMDRDARTLFNVLRRELRQSGFQGTTAYYSLDPSVSPGGITSPTNYTQRAPVDFDLDRDGTIEADETFRPDLAYRRRFGPNAADWSGWVVFSMEPDSRTGRNFVRRAVLSTNTLVQQIEVINNVRSFLVRQDTGGLSIQIVLVLERVNPHETDPDPAKRLVQRVYVDRVELLNPSNS